MSKPENTPGNPTILDKWEADRAQAREAMAEEMVQQAKARIMIDKIRDATKPGGSRGEWPPERIKALRVRLGITFDELAARLGVTRQTCQAWCVPITGSTYRAPRGSSAVLLEQLEAEAKVSNPMNIDLLTERQRIGKAGGGLKGTASRYGHHEVS